MAYRQLARLLEEAKPFIDFSRTILSVFGLSALCAVVVVGLWNSPPQMIAGRYLAWGAATCLCLVTVHLTVICMRLWWGLLMDLFVSELPEGEKVSRLRLVGMVSLGAAAFVIHLGTASLISIATVAAVTPQP